MKQAHKANWTTQTTTVGRSSKFRDYTHSAGWRIEHCRHPTALWPYLLLDPDGERILAGAAGPWRNPTYGSAWQTSEQAMDYVAEIGKTHAELLKFCRWNEEDAPAARIITDTMKKTLSTFTDDEIFSEAARRMRARQTTPNPKVLRPCPKGCRGEFGARELRQHLPHCPGSPAKKPRARK